MSVRRSFTIERPHTALTGEEVPGPGAPVVLLHPGVSDRRCWEGCVRLLEARIRLLSYDRPGYGATAPPTAPFSDVEDLFAVLNAVADEPVVLVGSSMGGRIAIDAALAEPDRVQRLLLIAPGASGAPKPELDPATGRLGDLIDDAVEAGDLDEVNRLEAWIWLDGPGQQEGRVAGAPRLLQQEMNRIILANDAPESLSSGSDTAWERLEDLDLPVTVACGDLDVPFLVDLSADIARRVPRAEHVVLEGVAHLPQLERPDLIADLITAALGS